MKMGRKLRTRLFAWWYFSIALGFFLLGINRWMLGESMWLIMLRFGIAVGFVLLAVVTLRSEMR
jgi:hypothetical protein